MMPDQAEIVRAAARRQVGRLFKAIPSNRQARLRFILQSIYSEIHLSLAEAGLSWDEIDEVNAGMIVRDAMIEAGYEVG